MIKLKNILSEVLNTYQVNAVIFTDSEYHITDILDQIRAVRKITIVRNLTPEDYPQKPNIEYTLVAIKFITRGNPEEDMEKIKEDILNSESKVAKDPKKDDKGRFAQQIKNKLNIFFIGLKK